MNSSMIINFYERFPRQLNSPKELPEPLRAALLRALAPDDSLRLLIFGPAGKILDHNHAATVLALLDSEWLWVGCEKETSVPEVVRCSYADLLLVTFTAVLLRGRLEMDYASKGRAHHVRMEFNTVMDHLYRQALQHVLDGMDAVNTTPGAEKQHPDGKLHSLPLRLQSVVRHSIPEKQVLRSLVYWPATYNRRRGLLRRELSPAAALLLTNREILLVSEEKAWTRWHPEKVEKYGGTATHCPLSRLQHARISVHEPLDTLDLTIGNAKGVEKVKIEFPRGREDELREFIRQTEQSPANV